VSVPVSVETALIDTSSQVVFKYTLSLPLAVAVPRTVTVHGKLPVGRTVLQLENDAPVTVAATTAPSF
jgi:hypothetical protein